MKHRVVITLALFILGVAGGIIAVASSNGSGPHPHLRESTNPGHALRATSPLGPAIFGSFGASAGTPHPGDVFTASTGTWNNTPTSYAYRWEDCDGGGNNCTLISGATTNSYTVQSSDLGLTLRVQVGACNIWGCTPFSSASTSPPTGLVATSGSAPTNASVPTITGTPSPTQTLTASIGTWSGTPTSYTYQWQDCDAAGANCTNVASGGTSSTYTVASGDANFTLRVGVIATNAFGSSTTANSASTALVGSNTLGYTTIGASCKPATGNFKRAEPYTLATAGTLTSFSIYLGASGTVGSEPLAGVVYADSSGTPGALVATSATITITQNSTTGWYTVAFPPTSLAAGTYWLGYVSGLTANIATACFDTAGSNIRDYNGDTFPGGPTNPFGTPSGSDPNIMSLYISYTPSGSGPSGPTAPTNLAATAGNAQVSLSWTAASETGGTIANYQIFRNGTQVATTTNTGYTDTGLTNGTSYSYFVKAVDGASLVSGASNTVTATPSSTATNPHTVPANPNLPAGLVPSGGWDVEYGDAFGACLVQTTTKCSAGYARADGSFNPRLGAHGDGNANEMASFVANENDVTSQGLTQRCDAIATSSDAYSCGGLTGNGAPKPFNWHMFQPGDTFDIEFSAQAPPDEGNMDNAMWATGLSWAWEVDFPEMWGYGWQQNAPNGSQWCPTGVPGNGAADVAVPKDIGGPTGSSGLLWCQTPGANFDPSGAFHTYDLYWTGATSTFYIDGTKINTQTWQNSSGGFNNAVGKFIWQNDMRFNHSVCTSAGPCPQGSSATAPNFPGGGNAMITKYIAVYEATSANHRNSNGPWLVQGTSIG